MRPIMAAWNGMEIASPSYLFLIGIWIPSCHLSVVLGKHHKTENRRPGNLTFLSLSSFRYTKGQRIGHGLLYRSYPTGFLGPVTFLWRHYEMQQDESQLWMWIHPSVYADAWTLLQAAIKDETGTIESSDKNRFNWILTTRGVLWGMSRCTATGSPG
jgi:hypothetical protein